MMSIINDREKEKFSSFSDIQSRIGLKDMHRLVAKRIIEEITKETRMTLFVGR
jgi:putative nucleotide binding protein